MKKINENNKGFSIVELVACVVLLAIVVTPLMRAFTRSTDYYDKARRKGEATAVAQNIRESVEAMDFGNIFDRNGNIINNIPIKDLANSFGAESFVCNNKSAFVKGISPVAGSAVDDRSRYDAVITFNEESHRDIVKDFKNDSKLNEFVQGRTSESGVDLKGYNPNRDPDVLSRNDNYDERRRLILIDIRTKEKSNGEITVSTKILYQYHQQKYLSAFNKCKNYDNWSYDRLLYNAYSEDNACPVHEFRLNDITLKSYEEGYTLRMSYYPFFENDFVEDTILVMVDAFKPDEGENKNVINDNELSKLLKFNLQLVKMTPVIETEGGWKSVDDSTKDKIVPGAMDGHDYAEADQNYMMILNVYYPANKTLESLLEDADDDGNPNIPVFSNALKRCFSDGDGTENSMDFYLLHMVLNPASPTNNERYDDRDLPKYIDLDNTKKSVLKKEDGSKIYSVSIDIYAPGHFVYDEDGNPVVNTGHDNPEKDKCKLYSFESEKLG